MPFLSPLPFQLANGEWKLLQGLGKGAELEAKCDYRVEECLTLARVLQAMNTGAHRALVDQSCSV